MKPLLLYIAINGFLLPSGTTVVEGNVLVPAKSLFQTLKAEVASKNDSVEANLQGKKFVFRNGKRAASIDGVTSPLPVASQIKQGQLLVPLRSVVESLGGQITWIHGFGSYKFADVTVPNFPQFSPLHPTYSPSWLFQGKMVTLNVKVKRFASADHDFFDATTEDGIPLHVYAGVNVFQSPQVGQFIRLSGQLQRGDEAIFKAHSTSAPQEFRRLVNRVALIDNFGSTVMQICGYGC
ncbi:copper amine oxidase N-terminal domain-containing protein [bacterium]|nr:MAG: copper amine oxidase N-terminal domain-containing protein [bacterium]